MKLYTAAWYPHLGDVLRALDRALGPERVVLRLSRLLQRARPLLDEDGNTVADGSTLSGDPPAGPVVFREAGLTFEADVLAGQKTGFFLDQRDNRARVRARSAGADVLDVFSAAGGFSVHAAAGGARSVHSVDISPGAIAAAKRNLALNMDDEHVRACRHRATTGDAAAVMASLAERGERYDVVVVDPPSFASRAELVSGALRAYRRLSRLALDLLRPGGWLVQASCSARVRSGEFVDAVLEEARAHGSSLDEVEVTGHALDHPVTFPEGEYLAAVLGRTRR